MIVEKCPKCDGGLESKWLERRCKVVRSVDTGIHHVDTDDGVTSGVEDPELIYVACAQCGKMWEDLGDLEKDALARDIMAVEV